MPKHYVPFREKFETAHLETLRAEYGTMSTVSPELLPKFGSIFDRCSDAALHQLATAKIHFVSTLARNAEIRRKEAM